MNRSIDKKSLAAVIAFMFIASACGKQTEVTPVVTVPEETLTTTASETTAEEVTEEKTALSEEENITETETESETETEVTEETDEYSGNDDIITGLMVEDDNYTFFLPDEFYDVPDEEITGADYEYYAETDTDGEYIKLEVKTEYLSDYGYSDDENGFNEYLTNFKSAAFYMADASGFSLSDEKENASADINGINAFYYSYKCPFGTDENGDYIDYLTISYAVFDENKAVTIKMTGPEKYASEIEKYTEYVTSEFSLV